jgi:hypothetical protein
MSNASSSLSDRTVRRIVFGLICLVTILRWVYLAKWSTLDLAPDEAHYWDWSRHLDWSYYSKGPLISWIIALGVACFGSLSEALTGNLTLAVRLPSSLFGAGFLWGLYLLSTKVIQRPGLQLIVVISAMTLPVMSAGALLMTIDSPFVFFWVWASYLGYLAVIEKRTWAWPAAGSMVCLGIMAKYTMALWLFSFGLFLLFSSEHRKTLFSRLFWLLVAVSGLSAIPILIWNSQNDWVTFKHVAVQAGVASNQKSAGIRWFGPLEYVVSQAGLLLLHWFVVWIGGIWMMRPWKATSSALQYLWFLSVPTFTIFGLSSIKSTGQLNWPITTYITGMILGAIWLDTQLHSQSGFWRKWAKFWLGFIWCFGLFLTLTIHHSAILYPLLKPIVGSSSTETPFPLRKVDPTCRLKGWRTLAAEVNRLRTEVRNRNGEDPIIAGLNWQLPGEIGVYISDHPPVYSLGLVVGDRHSQYDLWRPNPIDDAQEFLGKTFIVVGVGNPALEAGFDRVEPARIIIHHEDGEPIAGWSIWIAHGYHGFDKILPNKGVGRY